MFLKVLILVGLAFGAPSQYSYTNCGKNTDAIVVLESSLSPSPILYTKNVTLATSVQFKRQMTKENAGKVVVTVWKWALVSWVEVPCSVTGLCETPTNWCDAIAVSAETCSTLQKFGIPCACPINIGTYTVPPTSFGPVPVPTTSLADGSYRVKVELLDNKGARMLCGLIEDSVQHPDGGVVGVAAR